MAQRKYPPKGAAKTIEQMALQGHSTIGIAKHFGVSTPTIKRWFDESQELADAYSFGRDANRQALEEQVRAMGLAGKNPAGLIYLLKSKHKLYDVPTAANKIDVAVNNDLRPVLLMKDSGSDKQWAAKAQAQQARLVSVADGPEPKALQAPVEARRPAQPKKTRKPAPAWAGEQQIASGDSQPKPKREVRWKRGA